MIALILARWRLIAAGLVVLLSLFAVWELQVAQTARIKAEAAKAARARAEHATAVVDRYHQQTRALEETVEREADAVHQTPGAETALDPRRRADLCAALGRLRHDAAACDDPPKPSRALPTGDGGNAPDPG